MKKYILLLFAASLFFSCENKKDNSESGGEKGTEVAMVGDYASFGKEITADGAMTQNEMMDKYSQMKPGDTATIKFSSKVKSVCQMKGCWMKLALNPDAEAMVKFKDYDFFVPMDIAESDAIVEGKAYIEEMSIEDQQHYAKDAGKSDEEIAAITEPKKVYQFMADGVLIK